MWIIYVNLRFVTGYDTVVLSLTHKRRFVHNFSKSLWFSNDLFDDTFIGLSKVRWYGHKTDRNLKETNKTG